MPKQLPYGASVPMNDKAGLSPLVRGGGSAEPARSPVRRPTNHTTSNPLEIPHTSWHPEWMCDDTVGEGPARPCVIHRPSRHLMRSWPVRLGSSTLVERQCEHNYWHPDPDAALHFQEIGQLGVLVHNCDLCCVPEEDQHDLYISAPEC